MKEAAIVRTNDGLLKAQKEIEKLFKEYERLPRAPFSTHPLETWNLLIAAKYVVNGAIKRTENIGLHYNSDLL